MTEPLYKRDPAAWEAYLAEGNARQARKRVAVDALIRDHAGQILLVDPGYKPGWDLPGGMAEANESPTDCLRREIREELAIELHVGPMLVADWVPPHGPWDDLLAFIFDCGVFTAGQLADIRLLDGEIDRFEMCTAVQAEERLRERAWRRLHAALGIVQTGRAGYLEDGHPADPAADRLAAE
jgi:ADP-ribose pyrophosphatase YjhB (NUDIX family)